MQPFGKIAVILAVGVSIFCVAGFDAEAQQNTASSSPATPPSAATAKATVYVYRYREFQGSGLQPTVYCDDAALARMENGRYFSVRLEPGRHTFHSNDKQSGVELNLKPGQEYFLRVEIATGFWKGHGRIVTVMPEQGQYELRAKGLKPLGSDKVNDTARVSVEAVPEKSADAASLAK